MSVILDADGGEFLAAYPVARTCDVGQAREVLERVLPRIPLQVSPAADSAIFEMHMNAVDVGDTTTSYLRFGVDTRIQNYETAFYHVNLPLNGSTIWRAHSYVVRSTPSVAVVLSPGTSGELLWHGGCAQLCVMLPQSSLDRELERYLDRHLAEPVSFAPAMKMAASTTLRWLDALRVVLNEADRGTGDPLHPLVTRSMENLLVDSLLLAQRHNYTDELAKPARTASPKVVRDAMALLEECPAHPWSVGELAQAVHVSVRALQSAFTRSAGISPMRYLRQVRLSRVHAELLEGHPERTTVTEVATRWGFSHHGHFAALYRTRFGEPPATTLRR